MFKKILNKSTKKQPAKKHCEKSKKGVEELPDEKKHDLLALFWINRPDRVTKRLVTSHQWSKVYSKALSV